MCSLNTLFTVPWSRPGVGPASLRPARGARGERTTRRSGRGHGRNSAVGSVRRVCPLQPASGRRARRPGSQRGERAERRGRRGETSAPARFAGQSNFLNRGALGLDSRLESSRPPVAQRPPRPKARTGDLPGVRGALAPPGSDQPAGTRRPERSEAAPVRSRSAPPTFVLPSKTGHANGNAARTKNFAHGFGPIIVPVARSRG